MEHDFIIYQLRSEMWTLLVTDWKHDLITAKYWMLIAFIAAYYMLWWKICDKKRLSDLLLFGSFLAVMRLIIDLLGVTAGLWLYKVRVLPLAPSIFLHVLTITPLTYIIAQQYSPNWRQFFIWGAVAAAWVSFVLLPIFSYLGIFQPIQWNYIYGFLVSYSVAILARAAFHLVKQVQYKANEGYDSPLQDTLMQPAFKLLDEDKRKN